MSEQQAREDAHDAHIAATFTEHDDAVPTSGLANIEDDTPEIDEAVESDPVVVEADAAEDADPPVSRSHNRIQALLAERKADQEKMARMEGRFDALQASMAQPAQPALPEVAEIPDMDTDPAGHLVGTQAALQKEMAEFRAQNQQQQQATQQAQYAHQLETTFNNVEREFAAVTPDYDSSVTTLRAKRVEMWQGMGYSAADAETQVRNEAMNIIEQGLRAGKNPAEAFYAMSEPYRQAGGETEKSASRPQRPGGLGSKGSAGGSKKMTLASLADLPDSEFAKIIGTEEWHQLHVDAGMV
tara:strand:- start:5763 stop:6659 length:897 start_codon:yes stop_codon:yes gene_type:complete